MFYIQPPKGLMSFNVIEEIIFTRLEYLNLLNYDKSDQFNGNFSYLLENTHHDYVGHFTLRLLSSLSNEFFDYWLCAETKFLNQRLCHIYARQLNRLFRFINKCIKSRDNNQNPCDDTLRSISNFYLQSKVFQHITNRRNIDADQEVNFCTQFSIKVYFELIPDMVEAREVNLEKGMAVVYCCQWKELLQSVFKSFITFEVKIQSIFMKNVILSDPRMISLSKVVNQHLFTKSLSSSAITVLNINLESKKFPPCMEHLHKELRYKHRLSHYARFYYTLFLKDCGMKLEEAINYWKEEYCKNHDASTICTHNWQRDEKKFIYSIRHMYGLEGGRKTYNCPNCETISQEIPGPNYEGGCPFINFDEESFKSFLFNSLPEADISRLIKDISKIQSPGQKCAMYLKQKIKIDSCASPICNPVQYYRRTQIPE